MWGEGDVGCRVGWAGLMWCEVRWWGNVRCGGVGWARLTWGGVGVVWGEGGAVVGMREVGLGWAVCSGLW